MRDALRGYLSMANGLTDVTRQRATAAARALLAQGEVTAGQVSQLTDELLATSRSNREALSNLVRYEVDRTLDQMGLVTADKLRALTARVATLEAELRSGRAGSVTSEHPVAQAAMHTDPAAARPSAKKAAAKKAPAKKPARKPAAKEAPAKNAAKKAAVKKAAVKKAAVKKVAPSGATT